MPRVRGSGTIVQLDKGVSKSRCRRWQLRVSVGRDLASGRYRTMTRTIHGTYTEAKAALREYISEIERGDVVPKSGVTFGEYADIWLAARREQKSHGTWRSSRERLKNARLHLEGARLDEVTPSVLEDVYSKLLAGESVSGRPLRGTTVSDVAATLHAMFKQAVKDGLLTANPCDCAEAPSRDTAEKTALRRDGIVDLIDKLDPEDPIQFAIRLMAKTGIRRGEAHGLSAGDVDREGMILRIRHSFDDDGNLKEPKTAAGARDLPLTESAMSDIEARLDAIERSFARARRRYKAEVPVLGDDTPLVCNGLGERMLPHSSTRWWTRNRSSLGFGDITLHGLRHSYITELARRKVEPKVLQKIAGHAKYSTTMDIYAHVDMEDKRAALDVVDW